MIAHAFSKIIIYGAGFTAVNAYTFLGYGRVECFAVSDNCESVSLYNKPIIPYKEMIELYKQTKDYLIVIAADKYYLEMEERLTKDGIENYIVFHVDDVLGINDYLPFVDIYGKRIWKSYSEILSHYDIDAGKKIYVYGTNSYFKYLYLELIIRFKKAEISFVESKSTIQEKQSFLKSLDSDSVLIINVKHNVDDIRSIIKNYDYVSSIDIYDVDKFQDVYYHKELIKYRDIYKGERIFLVGNGPSLKAEDLNKLHANRALSIAFNKIYKIFERTDWRPTYIGVSDPDIARTIEEDKLNGITVFQGDNIKHWERGYELKNSIKFHLINNDFSPNMPLFSEDICMGTYRGCSVTYDMGLQFAVFMGCTEIILLGMDHSMTGNADNKNNHFCEDYFDHGEKNVYSERRLLYRKDEVTLAYEAAKTYADKHGIRILNATRGGNLEVFERVDFDNLF